jgi:hypothetical protein
MKIPIANRAKEVKHGMFLKLQQDTKNIKFLKKIK